MLTVTGARVQIELRGASCLPLSLMAPPRKGIAVSRTFGCLIESAVELREAVCTYTARAAEKRRAEGLEAGQIAVFTHTNPHNGDPWYSAQRQATIEPTADTGLLIGEAIRLLRAVWRPGYRYFKAGVMLQDLEPARSQAVLFASFDRDQSAAAMKAMDAFNARFGRGTLRIASTAATPTWGTRQQNRSPRYTTQIGEMLVVHSF